MKRLPGTYEFGTQIKLISGKNDYVMVGGDNREEIARLIEVAPELLAVCVKIAEWERDPDRYSGDLADLAQEAIAAIAKAEGASAQ